MSAQPSIAPIGSGGDEPRGCTGLLARAWMYTGRVDVMLLPSIFFARNVLVTAPDMGIAYERHEAGWQSGPADWTATTGSPSRTRL